MSRDRLVQLISAILVVCSLGAAGVLLPNIVRQSDEHVLRYTNVSVEGAPPFVVLGTAMGALRGLIVDYLWIKANAMKEKGLFYEAMADADLITKLQPRFGAVWAFHGHNMAYNISVATLTTPERWEWVNAGIRLVRDQGLRYNPNDMSLHRELAFWFAHKIEGVADDAHFYYKREICKEWHLLLGPPPEDHAERIEWIKAVADAPETLSAAEQRTPGVLELVEQLRANHPKDVKTPFALDQSFVREYVLWQAVKQQSAAAKILGYEQQLRERSANFQSFDRLAADPQRQDAWRTLTAHVRKRVLKDQYNMDPQLMYEYTRDLGPIDWRHGSAHSLYWSRKGSEAGRGRVSDYDIYIVINNDSQQITSMQDLARAGRISYDPFSTDMPGRFPDPRWIDVIDRMFEHFFVKHKDVRGAGGDRFVHFIQNFMSSAICEWFRAGETERADRIMKRMNALFNAPDSLIRNNKWDRPLDIFVHEETFDQYQAQPHLAPRDVSASLRYGFKVGILGGRPDVMREALRFAGQVTHWFKTNAYNDYITAQGTARIGDLLGDVEDSTELAYLQLLTDPTVNLIDRLTIWSNTDRLESDIIREAPLILNREAPALRALVYDRARPILEQQFANSELSVRNTFEEMFPQPPGLDRAREILIQREREREQKREEQRKRDPFERKS